MIYKALAFLLGMMSLLLLHSSSQALVAVVAATGIFGLSKFLGKNLGIASYLIFGLLWASCSVIYWDYYGSSLVKEPFKARVEGTVCSLPVKLQLSSHKNSTSQNRAYRFDFCINHFTKIEKYSKNVDLIQGDRYEPVSLGQMNKIKVSWSQYTRSSNKVPKAGDIWQLELKLRPIHSKYNPLTNDRAKWLLANNYVGTGSVRNASFIGESNELTGLYHQQRNRLFDHLQNLVGDKTSSGLIIAIILGDKSLIGEEQWEEFKLTGTSHLLAISGLHVGIAALWSYWLILFCWKFSSKLCHFIPAQKAAQMGAIAGALVLLLVSGMGLPAQRAFIMLVIFVISRLIGKNYSLLSVLSIALFTIIFMQPFSILAPGFWLSFFAVFIIAIVINRQFAELNKFIAWVTVNWYLFIALLPISLIFFGFYSVVSFLANLILIPLTSFVITPIVYLACIVSIFSGYFGKFLFHFADLIFSGMQLVQSNLADLQLLLEVQNIKVALVIALLLIMGFVLLPKKLISKATLVPLMVITASGFWIQPNKPNLRMTVLDIGQGLSIVVETPKHLLVYDTGWGTKDYSTAQSTLIPFLKRKGIRSIDKLIVSHADSDHAGGVNDLLENFGVKELLIGESLEKRLNAGLIENLDSINCHKSPGWNWFNVDFRFIAHINTDSTHSNNTSCVLSIEYEETKILLTGDIEKKVEKYLVGLPIGKHDILVAPHHGSKTSSTPNFVRAVSPKHVVFSTGFDNQWQFPRDEVVTRYLEQNSCVWITHQDGAVIFELYPDKLIEVRAWRDVKPHFWLNN